MADQPPAPATPAAADSKGPASQRAKTGRQAPHVPCWDTLPKPASDAHDTQPQQATAGQQANTRPGSQTQPQAVGDVRHGSSDGNRASGWQPGRQSEEIPAKSPVDRIKGLGDLPADWPKLPANASMSSEVAWVQANRLAVVEVKANGSTVVHLDRAMAPAPSMAALSWLETSIRSYAKWVEVAARASGGDQDDQAQAKRERARIEDIRAVLAEMLEERGESGG